jgi:hypothetical protein
VAFIKPSTEAEDPRRRLLIQALTTGFVSLGTPLGGASAQSIFGSSPGRLPDNQSIYRLSGTVNVNERAANMQTRIGAGDVVETGADGEVVFVVGGNAMMLRSASRLVLAIEEAPRTQSIFSPIINGLRMLTGKLLSVSRSRRMAVQTATATIGIRGTGFYLESEENQTYFCTCYGETDVAASADPTSRATVVSKHHDRPLYILADAAAGNNVRDAPLINHTDQELQLIEALVGRTPPFVFPRNDYRGPRRQY